jgi:hypothetical protein
LSERRIGLIIIAAAMALLALLIAIGMGYEPAWLVLI